LSGEFFYYKTITGVGKENEVPFYTEEFKEQVVRKMMPPNAMSVAQIRRDTGISEQTLYNWRNRFRNEGKVVPADPSNPDNWSGKNKLAVIIETASLNEHELAEYCRRKGLYPEQIERWKEMAISGNDHSEALTQAERKEWQQEKKKSSALKKELARKEKALAETAALLVLKKKAQAIWGEDGDE
jgi:transposase